VNYQNSGGYDMHEKHNEQINSAKKKKVTLQNFKLIANKVTRFEGIIQIIKTAGCAMDVPLQEKLNAIEKMRELYSVHMLYEAYNIPRGTFYNHTFRSKGDKERLTYFDAKTKLHLQEYLATRTDDNPALFVSIRKPATRITTGGMEIMMRRLGQRCNIEKCHSHRCRRTIATTALEKGMPIEQVQRVLGHS
jgi:integrase